MLSVNQQTFNKEVLKANHIVIVHFWAPWCGLCRLISPILLKFNTAATKGKIKFVSVNADNNLKLSSTYSLKSLPTILVFDKGNIIQRLEGFNGREELYSSLEHMMNVVFAINSFNIN